MATPLTRVDEALDHIPAVAETGTRVGSAVHNAVLASEKRRNAADVLHGSWLGHPLHPALTDITIGAWTVGAIFDVLGEIGDSDSARRTGDRLAAVGTLSALPTAVSGLADYSVLPQNAATSAGLHASLNTIGLGLYTASLWNRRKGNRKRGLLYSGLAFAGTLASAWIGGRMVYKEHVGIDHSEVFDGPRRWTPVVDLDGLPLHEPRRITLEGDDKAVLLYRDEEGVHAIGAVCSHAGGPLEEGQLDGACVQCPWHDSVFDVRSGRIVHGPATQPQPSFQTRTRDGRIELRLLHG